MGIIPTASIPVALAVVAAEAVEVSNVFSAPAATPCVKFYHPERRSGQLMQLCRNQECTCAEGKKTPPKNLLGGTQLLPGSVLTRLPCAVPPQRTAACKRRAALTTACAQPSYVRPRPSARSTTVGGWLRDASLCEGLREGGPPCANVLCCVSVPSVPSESGECHQRFEHRRLLDEDPESHQGRWEFVCYRIGPDIRRCFVH